MTPSEINDALRNRYNAVGDDFFSDPMILDIIYQACLEMSLETYCIESTSTDTSVAGTRAYNLPTNAIAIRRLEYDGKKIFPKGVDADPKTSTTEVSGTPQEYSIWNDQVILYPTPSVSSDEIKFYTYDRHAAVTAASTLAVPAEYHLYILDLGLSIFYAKDGNQNMSTYHRNLWRNHLDRIKRTEAKKKRGDEFVVVRDYYNDVPTPGDLTV